jgi:hypothetical protein
MSFPRMYRTWPCVSIHSIVCPVRTRRVFPLQMGVPVLNKSRALSLFAASMYSMLMVLGCNVQLDEDDPAVAGEDELGELEQRFTQCGTICPSGWHPTQYSCSYSCGGNCSFSGPNQVQCAPDSGTFNQCGVGCPSGWHPTQYGCSYSCGGNCSFSGPNQVQCAPDSGDRFTQCGVGCPSGWRPVQYSCSYSCGGNCSFSGPNQTLCERICDPRKGTHGQMWITETGYSQYVFRWGWCSVGTQLPAQCYDGTYCYYQSLVDSACWSVGSGGSCDDNDAWWRVTCNTLIDCTYDCNGQCVRTQC